MLNHHFLELSMFKQVVRPTLQAAATIPVAFAGYPCLSLSRQRGDLQRCHERCRESAGERAEGAEPAVTTPDCQFSSACGAMAFAQSHA